MDNGKKIIWITWERQQRNISLCKKFNAKYFELKSHKYRIIKYIKNICRTCILFRKESPDIIISQSPSIILAAFSVIYCKIMKISIIIDAHNAGIYPLEARYGLLNRITNIINRNADLVMVSNANLKKYLNGIGCNAVVLPDPLPDIKVPDLTYPLKGFSILYVCTWAQDEPYKEVLGINEDLKDIYIYVTGKYKKEHAEINKNKNIILTGFVDEDTYAYLLGNVNAVMVLTTREDCLVCGGYEAVAVKKPLILSNKLALKKYFRLGVCFTDNDSKSILDAIKECRKNYKKYKQESEELNIILKKEWDEIFQNVYSKVINLNSKL